MLASARLLACTIVSARTSNRRAICISVSPGCTVYETVRLRFDDVVELAVTHWKAPSVACGLEAELVAVAVARGCAPAAGSAPCPGQVVGIIQVIELDDGVRRGPVSLRDVPQSVATDGRVAASRRRRRRRGAYRRSESRLPRKWWTTLPELSNSDQSTVRWHRPGHSGRQPYLYLFRRQGRSAGAFRPIGRRARWLARARRVPPAA